MSDLAQLGFAVNTKGLVKGERALDSFARKGAQTEKKVGRSSQGMSSSFGGIAASIGSVATAMVALNKVVDVAREFDVLNAQLVTATGNAENAARAFEGIQAFATRTPFNLAQVTDSFVKLVNLGLTPSERAIESYGNTASAMGKSLNQLIEAVADAATGEFERLKEFGIKTKSEGDKVSFTFRGMTTTVKKEAEAIEGYLLALGENEFAGAMAQRVDTLDGAFSNLEDSWDKLFLSISKQGVGDFLEEQVRDSIAALDSLNGFIVSGQLQESLDLMGAKFAVFGEDINAMLEDSSTAFVTEASFWDDVIGNFVDLSKDAFFNFPENMRAALKLTGIELAHLVEMGKTIFTAFGEVFGVRMAELVLKAEAYGKALGQAMNPFSEDNFDLDAELSRLSKLSRETTNTILADAEAAAERNTQIKRDMVTATLNERDVAIASSDQQIEAIKATGIAFQKLQEEKDKATGDSLAEFKIIKEESSEMIKLTSAQQKEFEKLSDQVENFGGAWTRTGSVIVDTFGDMGDALRDYTKQVSELDKLQVRIDEARKAEGADQIALDELEATVTQEKIQAEMAGYSALAGAAASMFDQKTVAAKTFSAIQHSLAVLEIADLAAKAILNQGSGDPYTAFARMAAMAAFVGSMVSSFSGGGSVPQQRSARETQGTGTVLGDSDAKSESMLNSMELLADISLDQLIELTAISTAMTNVGVGLNNIGLTVSEALPNVNQFALANEGAVVVRGTTQYGNKTQIGYGDENYSDILDPVKDVFASVQSALLESSDILHLALDKDLAAYRVESFRIDLEGLTSAEKQEEINAVFGAVIDEMVGSVSPEIVQFQKIGEGLFETISRLTVEQSAFNSHLETMGLNLDKFNRSIFGYEIVDVTDIEIGQNIIELVGGLDDFNSAAQDLTSSFFTEQQQMAMLEDDLQGVFHSLGLGLSTSRKDFLALMQGIDITTESGQEMYATLLKINPELSDYLAGLESLADDKLSLHIDLLDAQGNAEAALALSRQEELKSMDSSLHALQLQVWAEEDRQAAMEESTSLLNDQVSAINTSKSAMQSLIDSINSAMEETSTSVSLESALAAAREGDFEAAQNLNLSALTGIGDSGFSTLSEQIVAQAINNAMIDEIGDLAQNQVNEYDRQIAAIESIESSAKATADEIETMRKDLMAANTALAKNTQETAKILARIEQDGLDVLIEE